jgi:hypothetical protein
MAEIMFSPGNLVTISSPSRSSLWLTGRARQKTRMFPRSSYSKNRPVQEGKRARGQEGKRASVQVEAGADEVEEKAGELGGAGDASECRERASTGQRAGDGPHARLRSRTARG